VVLDETGPGWEELPLRGEIDGLNRTIVEAFLELPHRQLMVLGQPGAGKTVFAILLLLGHIRHAEAGEPLPVLLPINAWEPQNESVDTFLARRLTENYRDVLAPHGDPLALAERLLNQRRILPILDGLDELPADTIAQAVNELDRFAAAGRPMVVTCRIAEYELAVRRVRVLSRTAVIELEAVEVEDAIAYLSQRTPDRRWEAVFTDLRKHPAGNIAGVFSSPLMVALARIAYQDGRRSPVDLITLPTRRAVTGRLMDTFVSSVYTSRRGGGIPRSRRADPAERARRWLSCLAYHLYEAGTLDLHWWQIRPDLLSARHRRPQIMTGGGVMTVAVLSAGMLIAWVGGAAAEIRAVFAAAIALSVTATGWLRALWPDGYPQGVSRTFRTPQQRRIQHWQRSIAYGLGCGLLTGLITSNAFVFPSAVACAAFVAPLPRWHPFRRAMAAAPLLSLRLNRRNIADAAIPPAAITGAVFAFFTRLQAATTQALLTGATAAAVYGTLAALNAGGWTWIRFRLIHMRLAGQGWLPWRLWAFLDDAHDRGVLRQAGAVYQFRHVLFQDHLARAAQLEHLQSRAHAGDRNAARGLATLLALEGRVDDLRARADAGDEHATRRLADLLAGQGHVDEAILVLRAPADRGDEDAAQRLADLLVAQGRVDEAIAVLRACADRGDKDAARRLADLLGGQGRVDDLRARADAGDEYAARRLADLLAGQGHVDEAIAIIRHFADAGNRFASGWLADLLAEHGRIDELRIGATAGDDLAAMRLIDLLVGQGHVDEAIAIIRPFADAGGWFAAGKLADLLAGQGHIDEAITILRARVRADAGDWFAAGKLADLLAGQGHIDEAITMLRARADAGDPGAAQQVADLLVEHGRIDELGIRAIAGDEHASEKLAYVLASQGHIDEAITILRARADAGDRDAAGKMADLLAGQGHIDEAITILGARADAGSVYALWRLPDMLAKYGRLDELRSRADAGDGYAAIRLAHLLAEQGSVDELRSRADAGEWYAAEVLADRLAGQGRIDEAIAILRARADAGDLHAAKRLDDLLAD
jgi:predicted negative regulator of RcsB-dependent stress response